jgi:hypothetical protein
MNVRRAMKRREAKPKPLSTVLLQLGKSQFHPRPVSATIGGQVMKAYCKRMANRSIMVGSTVFAFDAQGVCEARPSGRSNYATDFASLLKLNGVEELPSAPVEAAEKEAPAQAAPAAAAPVEPEVLPVVEPDTESLEEETSSEDEDRTKRRRSKRARKEND